MFRLIIEKFLNSIYKRRNLGTGYVVNLQY